MSNKLLSKVSFGALIKFTMPTMFMMVILALYTMVDGIFVARFVSANGLSAVNIVYPSVNVVIAVAIMLATGGSAVIAKKIGENNAQEARENFTLIIFTGAVIGVIIAVVGGIFGKQIIYGLGATEELFQLCYDYYIVLIAFAPLAILQGNRLLKQI